MLIGVPEPFEFQALNRGSLSGIATFPGRGPWAGLWTAIDGGNWTARVGLSELAGRLVEPARWIIIGGIAFTLANTVLFFIAPPTPDTGVGLPATGPDGRHPPGRQHPGDPQQESVRRGRSKREWWIPGSRRWKPGYRSRFSVCSLQTCRKNRLPSSEQKGQTGGKLFVVGETVPGNAELIEVHADHVVLRRAGSRETLNFPQVATNR